MRVKQVTDLAVMLTLYIIDAVLFASDARKSQRAIFETEDRHTFLKA
jgi:hypothetical protein